MVHALAVELFRRNRVSQELAAGGYQSNLSGHADQVTNKLAHKCIVRNTYVSIKIRKSTAVRVC